MRLLPLLVGALLICSTRTASAQEVRGTVTEVGLDAPLAGTLVALLDADSAVRATTITDPAGAFRLRAPVGDTLRLRVQRLGYATVESVPVVFAPGDSLRLEIRMRPQPVALEGVTATGEMRPELERFLMRRKIGFGRVYGPEELARIPSATTEVRLSALPGAFLVPGANGTLLAMPLGSGGRPCPPRVFVDEMPVETTPAIGFLSRGKGVPVSSYVAPSEILGVEVYRNPANAPPEFQQAFGGGCTVVLIWTNHSFGIGGGR